MAERGSGGRKLNARAPRAAARPGKTAAGGAAPGGAQYWSVLARAVFEGVVESGLVRSVLVVNGTEVDHFRQVVAPGHPLGEVRHAAVVWSDAEPRVEVRVTRGAGDEVALKVPESQAVVVPLGTSPARLLE